MAIETAATFELRGLQGCQENLNRLSDALQRRLVAKAARAAVQPVLDRVKATTYAPGRQRQSGNLLLGLDVYAKVSGPNVTAGIIEKRVPPSRRALVVKLRQAMTRAEERTRSGSNAFYWWFLEAGTKDRRNASGANRGKITPRPWVGPALDATALEALDAFAASLSDDLDAECAKLPATVNKGVL